MKTLICCVAVLLSACSLDSTDRSDLPLTLQDIQKKHLGVPFPKSASDIYYVFYSGGLQNMEFMLRFNVAPEDAAQAINQILEDNNKKMKRSLRFSQSLLPPAKPAKMYVDSQGRFAPVAWFSPQSIARGYMRSESESYAPTIWYDSENSIVYFYESD